MGVEETAICVGYVGERVAASDRANLESPLGSRRHVADELVERPHILHHRRVRDLDVVVQKRVVEYDLALWGDLDQSTAMYTGDPTEQLVDKLRLENSDVEARIILSGRWIPVPVVSRIEEDYAALAR